MLLFVYTQENHFFFFMSENVWVCSGLEAVMCRCHNPPLIRLVSCINCVLRAMRDDETYTNSLLDLVTPGASNFQASHSTERKSDPW